jgi:hypothetical protein
MFVVAAVGHDGAVVARRMRVRMARIDFCRYV